MAYDLPFVDSFALFNHELGEMAVGTVDAHPVVHNYGVASHLEGLRQHNSSGSGGESRVARLAIKVHARVTAVSRLVLTYGTIRGGHREDLYGITERSVPQNPRVELRVDALQPLPLSPD